MRIKRCMEDGLIIGNFRCHACNHDELYYALLHGVTVYSFAWSRINWALVV